MFQQSFFHSSLTSLFLFIHPWQASRRHILPAGALRPFFIRGVRSNHMGLSLSSLLTLAPPCVIFTHLELSALVAVQVASANGMQAAELAPPELLVEVRTFD